MGCVGSPVRRKVKGGLLCAHVSQVSNGIWLSVLVTKEMPEKAESALNINAGKTHSPFHLGAFCVSLSMSYLCTLSVVDE